VARGEKDSVSYSAIASRARGLVNRNESGRLGWHARKVAVREVDMCLGRCRCKGIESGQGTVRKTKVLMKLKTRCIGIVPLCLTTAFALVPREVTFFPVTVKNVSVLVVEGLSARTLQFEVSIWKVGGRALRALVLIE